MVWKPKLHHQKAIESRVESPVIYFNPDKMGDPHDQLKLGRNFAKNRDGFRENARALLQQ